MKYLVTGGTGTIGRAIVERLLADDDTQSVRVFTRNEYHQHLMSQEVTDKRLRFLLGDVRDRERVLRAAECVDYIFHAAALKHIKACEFNPFEAVKTNIQGTQNVIDAALYHNVSKMVHVSTDKAYHPVNTMGATKLVAERLVLDAHRYKGGKRTTFAVVRLGNVLASRGSVIETWHKQIAHNQPITITDPRATRYLISPKEAGEFIYSIAKCDTIGLAIPNMKSATVSQMAMAVTGMKYPLLEIGLQSGEKMHEWLDDEQCSGDAEMLSVTEIREMLNNA
jgi:FlaA1/EpsC-like NDP-sugar epimerase